MARVDALVDVVAGKYAPMPAASLARLLGRLRYAVPQWRSELPAAFRRAKERLVHARVDGAEWYWPDGERLQDDEVPEAVRLLAPFDPVVWDRSRFERFWGWGYRFEAYTSPAKRRWGYYALPLLWRDGVIGCGNLSIEEGALRASFGYVEGQPPVERSFGRELEAEVERVRVFLRAAGHDA